MTDKWSKALEIVDDKYESNFGSGYSASLSELLSIMSPKQRRKYRKATKKWWEFWK